MQMDGQSRSIVQRRSFTDTFFITAILTVALLSVGQVVGFVIWQLLPLPADSPVVTTGFLYYVDVGVWLVFVAYMMFTQKNRPIPKSSRSFTIILPLDFSCNLWPLLPIL